MKLNGETATHIRMFAWATPVPGLSLDDLEKELRSLGNEILEIDTINNRIKVADVTQPL